ncbi:hypothetical protein SK128_013300, partial [Halocaridina rubra]
SQTSLLLTVALLAMWLPVGVKGFSFGRLFPASRSGVRGTLISSLNSQKSSTSNALKEAVKEIQSPNKVKETVSQPVTNSPIFYIRLPPAPYVYMPGLGYVSPNTNTFKFVRPDLDFVNNGRPSSIYHYKGSNTTTTPKPTTTTETTTITPSSTTTTTTEKPSEPNKKPNSNITWLPGPWVFNGRPSNIFIFSSPHKPGHLDSLHKKYYKQRVLF